MTEIIIVAFNLHFAPVIADIRKAVFTIEQNIDEDKDLDGEDLKAVHVLLKEGGDYVGTGRMLADGHIGRLAILKPCRRKSLGTKVLLAFVEEARKKQLGFIYLGAQVHASGFYRKSGFFEYGEPYFDVGIEHIHMRYNLS